MGQSFVCRDTCCEEDAENPGDEVLLTKAGYHATDRRNAHRAQRDDVNRRSLLGACDGEDSPCSKAVALHRVSKTGSSVSMLAIALRYPSTGDHNRSMNRLPSGQRPMADRTAQQVIPALQVQPCTGEMYRVGSVVEVKSAESSKWFKAAVVQVAHGHHVVQYQGLEGIARLMKVPFGHTDIRVPGNHKMTLVAESQLFESESFEDNSEGIDEFSIVIDKQGGNDLGIDLAHSSTSLKISCVREGPVHKWNLAHPDMELMPGHVIVEVNGVRGSAQTLLNSIATAQVLKITVASETPSEKASEETKDDDAEDEFGETLLKPLKNRRRCVRQ